MEQMKFKVDTFIGQTVYDIEINVRADSDIGSSTSYHKHGIQIKELRIVHQTDYKIALSNDYITILDRQKENERRESYKHFLEEITVSIVTKETYFPNGVFCHVYSLKDPKKSLGKMKKDMISKIQSDYGFLYGAIQQIEQF